MSTFFRIGELTEQEKQILLYLSQHVGAYARERNGRCDGLGYRAEWIITDPDRDYLTVGTGNTEAEAWDDALSKESF